MTDACREEGTIRVNGYTKKKIQRFEGVGVLETWISLMSQEEGRGHQTRGTDAVKELIGW